MSEQHVTQDVLVDFLHGELPAAEDASIHAHLAECAACRESYESEAQLGELIRSHARAQERELPVGVVARIRDAVAVSQRPWWAWLGGSLRPFAVGAAVAAGLLIGTFVSLRGWHSRAQASTIDAAYYLDGHAALAATTPFGEGTALPISLTDGMTESQEQPAADETR